MLPDIQPGNTKILYFFNCLLDGMHTKRPLSIRIDFVTLCYGILTIETLHSFLQSFCFTGQNGAFSTTEQNQFLLIMVFSEIAFLQQY